MRIKSDFTDFYDYLASYGSEGYFYLRKPEIIYRSGWPFNFRAFSSMSYDVKARKAAGLSKHIHNAAEELLSIIISRYKIADAFDGYITFHAFIVGCFQPALKYEAELNFLDRYGYSRPEKKSFYEFEEFWNYLIEYKEKHKSINHLSKHTKNQTIKMIDDFLKKYTNVLCDESDAPILHIRVSNGRHNVLIEKNIRLMDVRDILPDGEQIWQELSMWFANRENAKYEKESKLSDGVKLEKAGFDIKASFRNVK
jgi:hypothetical protein